MPEVELCPVTFPHPHTMTANLPLRTTQSAYNFRVSNTKYVVRSRQSTQLSKSYAIVALEPSYGRQALTGPAEGEPTGEADPALGLLLHYHVPQYLEGRIEPGHLVIVPLRGTPTYGVVVELSESAPVENTRPITRVVDARPVLPPAMLELARWIAEHYRSTLWQAIAPMLPPGVARRAITTISLSAPAKEED